MKSELWQTIGNYVDPVAGKAMPASNGIIHYSKDGINGYGEAVI
ncbi:polymorphic toxin type 50 domain-containing protein [Pseudomonas sp. BYT-1]